MNMSVQQRSGRPNPRFNNNNRFINSQNSGSNFVKKRFKQQGQFNGQNNNKQRREAIIARNLQHMQQIAEKKRVAQELYYGQGRSPMVKTSSGNFIRQNTRVSVQERLGNATNTSITRINRNVMNTVNRTGNNPNMNRPKFVNRNIPNTSNKTPVKFMHRRNGMVTTNALRSDKLVRVQNFHNKNAIRNNMNMNMSNSNNSANGMIRTVGSNGKVLFLRPTKAVPVRKNIRNTTKNLSISVQNDGRHHIKQNLNATLQQEIKMIQAKGHEQIVQPQMVYNSIDVMPYNTNVDRLAITATKKTMNERFSSI